MNFPAAFAFPFRGPHRWPNIGCVLVCNLIPIIGPIVLAGYAIGIEKTLILSPNFDPPRFDFALFTDYLKRGLNPFLASLIFSLVFVVLCAPVAFAIAVSVILLQHHIPLLIALIILMVLLEFALISILTAIAIAITLKAGLEQTITDAFQGPFIKDFLKRVGLAAVGMQVLLLLCTFAAIPFIFCLPMVGPLALAAVLFFVQCHLRTQLYLLYLSRGGIPLHFQPDPPPPSFPVQLHGMPTIPPPAPPQN